MRRWMRTREEDDDDDEEDHARWCRCSTQPLQLLAFESFSRVFIITTTGSILQNRTHVSWSEGGKGSAGRNDESRMEQD